MPGHKKGFRGRRLPLRESSHVSYLMALPKERRIEVHDESDHKTDGRQPEWLQKLRDRNSREQRSLTHGTPFFDAAAMGQTPCIAMPGGIVVVNRKCNIPYC